MGWADALTDLSALTSAIALAATAGLTAATSSLREATAALEKSGGEAAKIGRACIAVSLEAIEDMAKGKIDQEIGQEVLRRELDATAEIAKGLRHAGGAELAAFVISMRRTLLEVGVPLLKVAASVVLKVPIV